MKITNNPAASVALPALFFSAYPSATKMLGITMKMSSRISKTFAALGIFFGCAAICSAQLTGGYKSISAADQAVVSAAEFAVAANNKAPANGTLKLVSIQRAEKQIVAGANYKMCLVLKSPDDSDQFNYQAIAKVFHNLKGEYSLTSWTVANCAPVAASKTNAAPVAGEKSAETLVKNLHKAHDADAGPFQKIALADQYFTKDLADLLRQEEALANGEVGVIDSDSLYGGNGGSEITRLTVGKPKYTGEKAVVTVNFRNYGKPDSLQYLLVWDSSKNWKISDIVYKDKSSFKTFLSDGVKGQIKEMEAAWNK